jgi:nucleoside-diphosphate-sugar epimerase
MLGYVPSVSLEEGLDKTIAWCRTDGALSAR